MARTTDARGKAVETAERLFRSQGVAATGLAQIISESGSPKGSFYFHFPDGKDQLAAEALAGFGARGRQLIDGLAQRHPGDAAGFVEALTAAFAAEMRGSGYRLGCVVQNLAAERAPQDAAMTASLEAVLASWIAAVAEHLTACGVRDAPVVATALVSALEGARTLARVQQSDAAFTAIATVFRPHLGPGSA